MKTLQSNKLIEDGKRISFDEIIKQNERINDNWKSQYKTMLSFYLKCKKKIKFKGFKNE